MTMILAFDVYGTLIDTHGLVTELREFAGDRAGEFSRVWREKQLEYSFRRGLMQQYETFAVCTRQALDYTSAYCNVFLTSQQKSLLLDRYAALPAFSDVASALDDLRVAGFRLFAFSNGTADAVETLFRNAGIREYFLDVLSVDDLCSFKPNPAVYSHFLRKSGATDSSAWLISSNPFDVIGDNFGRHAGCVGKAFARCPVRSVGDRTDTDRCRPRRTVWASASLSFR